MEGQLVLKPLTILTSRCDQDNRNRLEGLLGYRDEHVLLVIFFNDTWLNFLRQVTGIFGYRWQRWTSSDEYWPIQNSRILAKINPDSILEAFKVTTWYVPIEDCVMVNGSTSAQEAWGMLAEPLLRGGELIHFHHLLIAKDETNEIIGVVTHDQLKNFLGTHPISVVPQQRGKVRLDSLMIPVSQTLKFADSMSKAEVRKSLTQQRLLDIFRESGIFFLTDKNGRITGFETDTGLIKE